MNQLREGEQSTHKTIDLEKVNCPRCNSQKSRIVVKGQDFIYNVPGIFFVSECDDCKLWFQNPRPVADQVGDLYPSDYSPHAQATADREIPGFKIKYLRKKLGYKHLSDGVRTGDWKALPIFDSIKEHFFGESLTPYFVPGAKLLEIGCASGARLVELRGMGWENLFGIELVPEAVEKARAQGFQVECGLIEDKIELFPDDYFDVIITSMVVEHFFNPFEVFNKITKKLKPGGQFLFSTVVRDSLDGKLYKENWAGFDFPRHMVYFTKKDLLDALKSDYTNIRCYHQNAPVDFKRSSAWRIAINRANFLDRIIVKVADSRIMKLVGLPIAWLDLTTRVSIHCMKKK